MAINPLNNSYSNSSYLADLMSGKKTDANETADSVLSQYKSTKNTYSAYGANMYSGVGQSAMNRAINELKEANNGKVTFSMIQDYRSNLEEDFKKSMQIGLTLLGFEKTEDFQLMATPEGDIEIMCEDPELREAVAFLLEETKDLKDQFLYIQALGNIERAKGTMTGYMENLYGKASLQADSLDILLNGSDFINQISSLGIGYSSLLANFNTDSVQYMLGANYTV